MRPGQPPHSLLIESPRRLRNEGNEVETVFPVKYLNPSFQAGEGKTRLSVKGKKHTPYFPQPHTPLDRPHTAAQCTHTLKAAANRRIEWGSAPGLDRQDQSLGARRILRRG